jgi:hypothetical protein
MVSPWVGNEGLKAEEGTAAGNCHCLFPDFFFPTIKIINNSDLINFF